MTKQASLPSVQRRRHSLTVDYVYIYVYIICTYVAIWHSIQHYIDTFVSLQKYKCCLGLEMFAGSIQDRLRARDQDKFPGRAGYPVNVSGHQEKSTLCFQHSCAFPLYLGSLPGFAINSSLHKRIKPQKACKSNAK